MNTLNFKDNQQGITRDINQKKYLSWLGGFFEGEPKLYGKYIKEMAIQIFYGNKN